MHKQFKGFTVNPLTLKTQQLMEYPLLGEFSVLVLAAAVAHQMEVVAPPKLWASILVNQQALVVPSSESCSVKDEYGRLLFQSSTSEKKIAAPVHNESKVLEACPSTSPKPVARRTQGCMLFPHQFVATIMKYLGSRFELDLNNGLCSNHRIP